MWLRSSEAPAFAARTPSRSFRSAKKLIRPPPHPRRSHGLIGIDWKKIQQAWEAGDKQIALRVLGSMLYELRLKQRSLLDFQGEVLVAFKKIPDMATVVPS